MLPHSPSIEALKNRSRVIAATRDPELREAILVTEVWTTQWSRYTKRFSLDIWRWWLTARKSPPREPQRFLLRSIAVNTQSKAVLGSDRPKFT